MVYKNPIFVHGWMLAICLLSSAAIVVFAPHTYLWGALWGVFFSSLLDHAVGLLQSLKEQREKL